MRYLEIAEALATIQAEKARTWPLFYVIESDIVRRLKADKDLGLEDAYTEALVYHKRNQLPKAKERGAAFVNLYAAAKQITEGHESRYPYLQYWVKHIEAHKLAPPIKKV